MAYFRQRILSCRSSCAFIVLLSLGLAPGLGLQLWQDRCVAGSRASDTEAGVGAEAIYTQSIRGTSQER